MRNYAGGVQGVKVLKTGSPSLCDTVLMPRGKCTGNDRLKLDVIHTAKRPRDFGRV